MKHWESITHVDDARVEVEVAVDTLHQAPKDSLPINILFYLSIL